MSRIILCMIIIFCCVLHIGCLGDDSDQITRVKSAKASLQTIYNAVQRYQMTVDEYPEKLTDLVYGPVGFVGNWKSMLVGGESALKDPWGNYYEMTEDENGEIIIVCYGRDGVEGGENNEYDEDLFYPPPFDE